MVIIADPGMVYRYTLADDAETPPTTWLLKALTARQFMQVQPFVVRMNKLRAELGVKDDEMGGIDEHPELAQAYWDLISKVTEMGLAGWEDQQPQTTSGRLNSRATMPRA